MTNLLIVAFATVWASVSACMAVRALNASADKGTSNAIFAEPDTFDLGLLRQRTTATATFTIRNGSRDDIFLRTLSPSCSCTVADFKPHLMPGGGMETIALKLNVGSRRGLVESLAVLNYGPKGEPDAKSLVLKLRATVEPDFDVSPESLTFSSGRPESKEIRLRAGVKSRLEIRSVKSTNAAISVGVAHETPSEKVVTVHFDPKKWEAGSRFLFVHVEGRADKDPMLIELPVRVLP